MKMMKTALLLLAFLCVAWAQDVLEYDDYDSVRRLYYCYLFTDAKYLGNY